MAERSKRSAGITEPRGRFPRAQHVRKRAEFQAIQAEGRRLHTRHFVLLLRARDLEPSAPAAARLGITAPRRVGSAVLRNRVKRLIREAFRATRDLWPDAIDVVVIVRSRSIDLDRRGVVDDFRSAALRIASTVDGALADREKRQNT